MFQLVARAPLNSLLFRTHVEARGLWVCLTDGFPEARGLLLMPTHVHLDVPHCDPSDRLRDAMSAFARWRNHLRGESGGVWDPHPEARTPNDAAHARRLCRYTYLNPVRAAMAVDPLEWHWSLYRERLGLGFTPGFSPDANPRRLHRFVSENEVTMQGTPFPSGTYDVVKYGEIIDAVCGVTRSFVGEILRRGRPRTLFLQTAWAHDLCDVGVLAAMAACTPDTVYKTVRGVTRRGGKRVDRELTACLLAVGDARFSPLFPGDLRATDQWQRSKYWRMD